MNSLFGQKKKHSDFLGQVNFHLSLVFHFLMRDQCERLTDSKNNKHCLKLASCSKGSPLKSNEHTLNWTVDDLSVCLKMGSEFQKAQSYLGRQRKNSAQFLADGGFPAPSRSGRPKTLASLHLKKKVKKELEKHYAPNLLNNGFRQEAYFGI
jgi:hypothetical protein